jgi:hypothetical protein
MDVPHDEEELGQRPRKRTRRPNGADYPMGTCMGSVASVSAGARLRYVALMSYPIKILVTFAFHFLHFLTPFSLSNSS